MRKGLVIIITNNKSAYKKYILLFLFFLSLDQVSKMAIRNLFSKTDVNSIPVLGNFFRLTFVENQGAVFGIDPRFGNFTNIILLLLHIIAIIVIIYLFMKNKHSLPRFSFTLILSGAFGNLIDRIFFGKVTDFLDVDFLNITIGKWQIDRWYVFNIADSCIVVGVILLIIYYLFVENSAKEEEILEKE
ncbi:MAG TPA: signal peptidase II [Candidatus Cloacimonetes bacterium]|nr:signal peptidase II [Candidatus Cloacimonadota bacterium]